MMALFYNQSYKQRLGIIEIKHSQKNFDTEKQNVREERIHCHDAGKL